MRTTVCLTARWVLVVTVTPCAAASASGIWWSPSTLPALVLGPAPQKLIRLALALLGLFLFPSPTFSKRRLKTPSMESSTSSHLVTPPRELYNSMSKTSGSSSEINLKGNRVILFCSSGTAWILQRGHPVLHNPLTNGDNKCVNSVVT